MKLLWQSLMLIASFVLIFTWSVLDLQKFSVPVIGFLTICYLLLSMGKSRASESREELDRDSIAIFFLTTTVLLLVTLTGGFSSPVFFILFFLMFWIGFVLLPHMVFVFTACLIMLFAQEVLILRSIESYLKLGSLLILSPIAYYFGLEFRKREAAERSVEKIREQTANAADSIAKDVTSVLQNEKGRMKLEDLEKLDEVLEQADQLRRQAK